MSDMVGGVGDRGRRPVQEFEVEALLGAGGTVRDELASLDHFLEEIRAPYPRFDPRPSVELVHLFAEGPDGVAGPPPGAGNDSGDTVRLRRTSAGRRPVRRLAKVAAVTTSAALALTLAAAAQVLPGTRSTTSVSASGPATPVPGRADLSVTVRTPDVLAAPGLTVQPLPTTAPRPTATVRSAADAGQNALSADALARLPLDVLKALSPENLARLPVEVLRTLPGDTLARLSPAALETLPSDVLARLPVDVLRAAPGEVLVRLSVDVLRTLPAETLVRLPADAVRTLPGDLLARLPLDLLRGLPADVQGRLPADILRLVLVTPASGVTTSTVAVRP